MSCCSYQVLKTKCVIPYTYSKILGVSFKLTQGLVHHWEQVSVIICLVPLQLFVAKTIGQMRKKTMKATDARVGTMNELLASVQSQI